MLKKQSLWCKGYQALLDAFFAAESWRDSKKTNRKEAQLIDVYVPNLKNPRLKIYILTVLGSDYVNHFSTVTLLLCRGVAELKVEVSH